VGVALGLASELLVDWAGQSRQYAAPDILSAFAVAYAGGCSRRRRRGAWSRLRSPDAPAIEASPLLARLHSLRSQYDGMRDDLRACLRGLSLREVAPRTIRAGDVAKELQHFAVRSSFDETPVQKCQSH